jgi:hypothetical protein
MKESSRAGRSTTFTGDHMNGKKFLGFIAGAALLALAAGCEIATNTNVNVAVSNSNLRLRC